MRSVFAGIVVAVLALPGVTGCDPEAADDFTAAGARGDRDGDDEADGDACAPDDGFVTLDPWMCIPVDETFSPKITNPYFPMPAGQHLVLEGEDDGRRMRVEISALADDAMIAGQVPTRPVERRDFVDGQLRQVSTFYYAQAPDGTVCSFGEVVDRYLDGMVVGHDGSWRAGQQGAWPGIVMPGTPHPRTQFAMSNAPGVAQDFAAILEVGARLSVPAGDFDDVVHTVEWSPVEGETRRDGVHKYFADGTSLVMDGELELQSCGIH